MSQTQEKIWKAIAPLAVLAILLLIPVPDGMPPQAWHYFAIFVAMIVGMILEPIPATAISFIAVTVSVLSANWVLFGAQELAEPGFKAGKEALKWGLAGFSSTTVWLVFGAFIFALGYEATGLGRRIALFLVKFMGKRTLTLGYAVVIIDILLAPFTPSNTARTGGTVFPVVKTCRRCSIPSPTILFTPHRRLPDVDDGGRHQHQLLDVRHRRRAERAGHRVRRQDRRGAHQLDAVVPGVPAGRPAAADHRAADLLLPVQTGRDPQQRSGRLGGYRAGEMGKLTRKEYTLIGLVLLSLCLWVFGGKCWTLPRCVCWRCR